MHHSFCRRSSTIFPFHPPPPRFPLMPLTTFASRLWSFSVCYRIGSIIIEQRQFGNKKRRIAFLWQRKCSNSSTTFSPTMYGVIREGTMCVGGHFLIKSNRLQVFVLLGKGEGIGCSYARGKQRYKVYCSIIKIDTLLHARGPLAHYNSHDSAQSGQFNKLPSD